jgi:penicillin-binding protein 1C
MSRLGVRLGARASRRILGASRRRATASATTASAAGRLHAGPRLRHRQARDPRLRRRLSVLRRGGPIEECDAHREVAVDARDGLLASSATPARFVEVRTFTALPPRYAAWAVATGLKPPPTRTSPLDTTGEPRDPPPPARWPPALRILAPQTGVRVARDPESPADAATLALRVVVDPRAEQVVWYVDGAPWQVVAYPYTTRWPLAPGEHTFQARLPWTTVGSTPVRVFVQ